MNRRLTALTLATVALLGLTACSGSPEQDASSTVDAAASDQTVPEACTEVNDVMTEATAGLQDIDPSDPATAATALRTISDGIGDAVSSVSNAEISGVLPDLQTAFSGAADTMEAVAAGDTERAAELNTAITDIQSSLTEFTELCGAS